MHRRSPIEPGVRHGPTLVPLVEAVHNIWKLSMQVFLQVYQTLVQRRCKLSYTQSTLVY